MKINELFEAINQTSFLTQTAYKMVSEDIDNFIKTNTDFIFEVCGAKESYRKVKLYSKLYATYSDKDNWEEAAEASDKKSDAWSEVGHVLGAADPNMRIIDDFNHMIEQRLQDIARDYFENQFGEIEKKGYAELGQEIFNRNLHQLQKIIVQIDIYDPLKTSGGYFSRYGKKDAMHNVSSQSIDWHNDTPVHVNIYSSVDKIWKVITDRLYYIMSVKMYDEGFVDNPVPKFLRSLLHTYVHEVVHLEQYVRQSRYRKDKKQQDDVSKVRGFRTDLYTHLPDPTAPRKKVSSMMRNDPRGPKTKDNQERTYKQYRAGRRGEYNGNPSTPEQWASYAGSVREIESHAAHAASEIYMDYLANNERYHRGHNQRDINDHIDYEIQNIQYGANLPNNLYSNVIAAAAREAARNPNPTTREKKYLQVWKEYLKKVAKHLSSYKKPIAADKDDY